MDEFLYLSSILLGNQKKREKVDINSFYLLRVVGKGSYGKVVMVKKRSNGHIHAMKILKKAYIKNTKHAVQVKTERQILEVAQHPFIVNLLYAFQNENKLYFVLEYCPGGELFNLLQKKRRFSEDQAKFYIAQVILAVGYLHSKNIIYRDLKPENILIDKDGYVKITDFGLSKQGVDGSSGAYSICGTPEYLSPEILLEKGHGKPVDWWALGALIFELILGLPPFYSADRQVLFDSIKYDELVYPNWMSSNLKNLLERLFKKDPSERIGSGIMDSEEIKDHPWFAGFDWEKLYKKELPAPFIPTLKSETDFSYFDQEFTECPVYSFHRQLSGSYDSDQSFPDFSFEKYPSKNESFEKYALKPSPEQSFSGIINVAAPEGESGEKLDLISLMCCSESSKDESTQDESKGKIALDGGLVPDFDIKD